MRWNPSERELRQFAAIWLPLGAAVIGAMLYWRGHLPGAAKIVWGAGLALTILALAIAPLRRPLYIAWMGAAYPIGWTVSHLLLLIIYYLILTPVGLLVRATGRDSMERRFDRSASTYWIERNTERPSSSYFRQY